MDVTGMESRSSRRNDIRVLVVRSSMRGSEDGRRDEHDQGHFLLLQTRGYRIPVVTGFLLLYRSSWAFYWRWDRLSGCGSTPVRSWFSSCIAPSPDNHCIIVQHSRLNIDGTGLLSSPPCLISLWKIIYSPREERNAA